MTRTALALLLLTLAAPAARAADDPEMTARAFLDAGSALFDARDAAGLAATYIEDGEVVAISREQGSDSLKTETRRGRAAIEQLYREVFKDQRATTSKNTVQFARFVGPDLLVVHGSFRPDIGSGEWPFIQLRRKQGDQWKIVRLDLFLIQAN